MASYRKVRSFGFAAIAIVSVGRVPVALAAQAGSTPSQCTAMSDKDAQSAAKNKALDDPKSTGKTIDAVLRELVITVKLQKQIETACKAEGNAPATTQARLEAEGAGADDLIPYVKFVSSAYRETMAKVEEARVDKQVGTGPSAAGTTSVATKGSVPSLLGFAVEHGALLKETDGSVVSFELSPVNAVRALAKHDYLASAPDVVPGTFTGLLAEISVSASFDTSQGATPQTLTAKSDQLAGFGFHYQILNWRDPRNVRYAKEWSKQLPGGNVLAAELTALKEDIMKVDAARAWEADLRATLTAATPDTVEGVIVERANALKAIVVANEALSTRANVAGQALADYMIRENETLKQISKSLVVAFDYSQTNQFAATTGAAAAGATPAELPDLGNLKLTMAKGFLDGPEVTGNISATLFVNRPSSSTVNQLRDTQAAAELTVPLPKINNIGNAVLAFAGLWENLRQEPLGAKIKINGKQVTRTGNIGLFQIKVTVPTGDSGVAIPVSVTWSNRTELIDENKTIRRFNVGFTLDLDKLFAKPSK